MTLPDLMHALDAAGVKVDVRLSVDAPAGALTPELRDALARHKPMLLVELARQAHWKTLSVERWGPSMEEWH
jgi:hypothetical protein